MRKRKTKKNYKKLWRSKLGTNGGRSKNVKRDRTGEYDEERWELTEEMMSSSLLRRRKGHFHPREWRVCAG